MHEMCVGLKLQPATTIVSEPQMMLPTVGMLCPAMQMSGFLSCSGMCLLLARPITLLPSHISRVWSCCRQRAHRVCLQCGADCSPPVHASPPNPRFQVLQASCVHQSQQATSYSWGNAPQHPCCHKSDCKLHFQDHVAASCTHLKRSECAAACLLHAHAPWQPLRCLVNRTQYVAPPHNLL